MSIEHNDTTKFEINYPKIDMRFNSKQHKEYKGKLFKVTFHVLSVREAKAGMDRLMYVEVPEGEDAVTFITQYIRDNIKIHLKEVKRIIRNMKKVDIIHNLEQQEG